MKRHLVPMIVLVALAAGVLADPAPDERGLDWSPVVYPMQRLPLIFSHAKHLARGVACAACHPTAATSQSAVDNLIPTEIECRGCHAIDRAVPAKVATPVAACTGCHPGWRPDRPVERVYLTPPPLKFAHAAHAQAACESCHTGLRELDLATTRQLPTMTSCLRCHTSGTDERHCADCHLARLGGLIQTQFEHGQLVPGRDGLGDQHGPGFAQDHKREARQIGATCTACHDRSECVACHQGVVKPMDFHPGDYVHTHAIDARRGRPDCSACHRAESFCVACHERAGLGTRADSQFDPRDPSKLFHPAGWASPGIGPNLHAREARRNVTACASCHREEDCLACHSAEPGGVRASPHPPSWRGSARCRALDRGNRRMCLRCHITQDELGCDWHK
jgi:Cytochrome c7 and related cytochrome c